MKPSVHLSRAFGYRELGIYYQFFPELEEIIGVTEYIRKSIKMDGSLRAEFVEDSAFDAVWDFF